MATQLKAEHKRFDKPDEVRSFPKGRNELVTVGGLTFGRLTMEPGYHWAEHMKPTVGTETCQVAHAYYIASGRIHIRMDTGEEFEMGAGEVAFTPPGHDVWVVGDEPLVEIEVLGASEFAKPR